MKGEDLLQSMEYIDAALIEEAEYPTPVKKKPWLRITAIAACLAILIGGILLAPRPYSRFDLSMEQLLEITDEGENIAGDSDRFYRTYVSENPGLSLNPLPTAKTALIFNRNDMKLPESKAELKNWTTPILERMCESLGVSVSDYKEKYDILSNYGVLNQSKRFCVEATRRRRGNCELRLNGELVTIDPSLSDEEILASLESIKQKLFAIFDVKFSDAKVVRYSLKSVHVIFYDESAHPLNKINRTPFTDRIIISADIKDYDGIVSSDDDRITTKIIYRENRIPPYMNYQILGYGKLISLDEAEEKLAKGYVFGRKNLTDYDHVSFVYVEDSDRQGMNLVVPFYVFYKKINEEERGSETYIFYATAYVCAIEIPGLEEYFEKQK